MVRTSSAPNSRIILSRVHIFRPTTIVEIAVNSQIMMSILGPLLASPSGGGTIDGCCKDPMMVTWKTNDIGDTRKKLTFKQKKMTARYEGLLGEMPRKETSRKKNYFPWFYDAAAHMLIASCGSATILCIH